MKKYNRNLFIYLMLYVVIISISPYISTTYFNNKDFAFKENVGFLPMNRFDDTTYDLNQDVQLDYEVMVSSDIVSINDKNYRTVFGEANMFEIGMPSIIFSKRSNFYAFEFLYGSAYTNDLEIVISESISNELFNKTNSVGETITIMGETFRVSGVVTEPEQTMAYIYFTNEQLDINPESDFTMYQSILFQDDQLPLKLYEKGGLDLISDTVTKFNRSDIHLQSLLINDLGLLLLIGIKAFYDALRRLDVEDEPSVVKHKPHYLKSFMGFVIWTTLILTAFVVSITGFYSSLGNLRVGWMITRDGIFNNLWILSIYIIPFIYIAVKMLIDKLKNNIQKQYIE